MRGGCGLLSLMSYCLQYVFSTAFKANKIMRCSAKSSMVLIQLI